MHRIKQELVCCNNALSLQIQRIPRCTEAGAPPADIPGLKEWFAKVHAIQTLKLSRESLGIMSRCRKSIQLCDTILALQDCLDRLMAARAHLSLVHTESEGIRHIRANIRAHKVRESRQAVERRQNISTLDKWY